MKKAFLFLALPFVLPGCDKTTEKAEVAPVAAEPEQQEVLSPESIASLALSNPSEFTRPDTLVRFPLNELGVTDGPLQVWEGDTPQATQLLDDDGDNQADSLVFLTHLNPSATHSYAINRQVAESELTSRAHAEVSIKEGGEWQDQVYVGGSFKNVNHVTNPPQYTDHSEYIRYEGPGIESDRVGYRVYLDWRNGFDIFGKQKPGLGFGRDGSYRYYMSEQAVTDDPKGLAAVIMAGLQVSELMN